MALTLITAPTLEPITVAEARRQLQLNSSSGEPAPTAPTVALASPAVAGNCDNGDHRVGVTFVTADGETEIGPLSAVVTVADKTVNGKLAVSAIAIGGSAVTSRKLYLVPVAGGSAKLAATVSNNTATTATLSVADASLGVEAPTTNTTADPELTALITTVRERAELATGRALITQTWDLLLDAFPSEGWIEIPKPPLQSVTHLKYTDTNGDVQTWAASNYLVQAPSGPRARSGRLALAFAETWPIIQSEMGAGQIRFVCGYGAAASSVPAFLKSAMLIDLATVYTNRGLGSATLSDREVRILQSMYWSYRVHPTQRVAA